MLYVVMQLVIDCFEYLFSKSCYTSYITIENSLSSNFQYFMISECFSEKYTDNSSEQQIHVLKFLDRERVTFFVVI